MRRIMSKKIDREGLIIGILMSVTISISVSLALTLINLGISEQFWGVFLKSVGLSIMIGFPVSQLVFPYILRFAQKMTETDR
jgi:hypothetical protein